MRALLAFALVVLTCTVSVSSERGAVQVTQPIGGTGNDVVLGQVLYVDFYSVLTPYMSVRLTASENAIRTDRGIEDLNLAHQLGIEVKVLGVEFTSLDDAIKTYASRETLQVEVALPPRSSADTDESLRRLVVDATKQCVLENARRYWPRVKHVTLRVTGDPEFSRLSGEYPLENIVEHVGVRSGWRDR